MKLQYHSLHAEALVWYLAKQSSTRLEKDGKFKIGDSLIAISFNPLTTISVPFGYKIKRLHSLPQTSNCGDLLVLDNAKVKWQVVSAVAS